MPDQDTFEDALVDAVDSGRVLATCSGCAEVLSPDEHFYLICLRCGHLSEDMPPLYSTEEK